MMAMCIWMRTAFSDSPQNRLTWRCCLIHLNSLCVASHKFFRQIKQNFPLRYFYGESANAIKIQIWVTLIANLLLTLMQRSLKRKWSFSGLATMTRILLMCYVDYRMFFENPERDWQQIQANTPESPPRAGAEI